MTYKNIYILILIKTALFKLQMSRRMGKPGVLHVHVFQLFNLLNHFRKSIT